MAPDLSRPFRLAVLFSGSGSTLQNLIDATRDGRLPGCEVTMAVSSREGVLGVERCGRAGVRCAIVPRKQYPLGDAGVVDFSQAVFERLDPEQIDLICLAGWMSKLVVPEPWLSEQRVLNIHPSLLPSFGGPGLFGRRVHEAVLARGCKVSGCTVHVVDNDIDAGPILAQQCVPVLPGDTPDALAERVQATERELYPQVVAELAAARR